VVHCIRKGKILLDIALRDVLDFYLKRDLFTNNDLVFAKQCRNFLSISADGKQANDQKPADHYPFTIRH
jgi:hypothetical protein